MLRALAPSYCSRTSARRRTVWLGAWVPAPPPSARLHMPPSTKESGHPCVSDPACVQPILHMDWFHRRHRERLEDDAAVHSSWSGAATVRKTKALKERYGSKRGSLRPCRKPAPVPAALISLQRSTRC